MEKTPFIAVVDDDASIRGAICNLVEALGYTAESFESAEDFLESEQIVETSCAIVDVHMGGMTGIDLLHHLVEEERAIPIILITAFPQDVTRKQALLKGAVGYLAKPLLEEGLVACLRQALEPSKDSRPS